MENVKYFEEIVVGQNMVSSVKVNVLFFNNATIRNPIAIKQDLDTLVFTGDGFVYDVLITGSVNCIVIENCSIKTQDLSAIKGLKTVYYEGSTAKKHVAPLLACIDAGIEVRVRREIGEIIKGSTIIPDEAFRGVSCGLIAPIEVVSSNVVNNIFRLRDDALNIMLTVDSQPDFSLLKGYKHLDFLSVTGMGFKVDLKDLPLDKLGYLHVSGGEVLNTELFKGSVLDIM